MEENPLIVNNKKTYINNFLEVDHVITIQITSDSIQNAKRNNFKLKIYFAIVTWSVILAISLES